MWQEPERHLNNFLETVSCDVKSSRDRDRDRDRDREREREKDRHRREMVIVCTIPCEYIMDTVNCIVFTPE